MNLTEGDDSLLRHTQNLLARDIIISLQWHNVSRELRDYSLGQIAFAVFQVLFAITQLLCHVSGLLISACNDTLLHRELQDYSLGQIAFAVFKYNLLSHSCFAM